MIKNIIILAGCTIASGFIGYKIGVKKAQKFADEQVNSTKRALKNYYNKKLSEKDDIINEFNKNMVPKDLGVDPSINDTREQFPGTFEDLQPYELTPNFKELLRKKEISEDVIKSPDLIHKAQNKGYYKQKDQIAKKPIDLPPTAIDTPDGYPDPNDISVEPYLIRDVDYGTIDDFELQELVLWNCGTVTTDDASYDIVEPKYLFELLPIGWSNMFGWGNTDKYMDSLYFRNNKEKKDIQITKQHQNFKDWVEQTCPGRLDELEED